MPMTSPRSLGAALALAGGAHAQAAPQPAAARTAPFNLTVASIMRGPLLVGRSPDEVRWSADSRQVWFRWRQPETRDTTTHLYRVAAAGGAPVLVADAEAYWAAPAQSGDWTADRARRAEERNGDIFVVDAATGREHRITQTPTAERAPHLSTDGRTVYFVSGNNVWATAVDGGTLRQVTDIRTDDAPRPDSAKGQRGVLESQQRDLFGVIRDRRAEKEHGEQVDSLGRQVRPVYIGKNTTLSSAEISPSGRYLLITVGQRAEGQKQPIVANFVTESGYTEPINVRTKVGDVQPFQRTAMVEVATGAV